MLLYLIFGTIYFFLANSKNFYNNLSYIKYLDISDKFYLKNNKIQ